MDDLELLRIRALDRKNEAAVAETGARWAHMEATASLKVIELLRHIEPLIKRVAALETQVDQLTRTTYGIDGPILPVGPEPEETERSMSEAVDLACENRGQEFGFVETIPDENGETRKVPVMFEWGSDFEDSEVVGVSTGKREVSA